MKRPLAAAGISMLITLFVLCKAQSMLLAFAGFFFSIICLVIGVIIKKSRQSAFLPTVFGSVAAACLLLMFFENFYFLPIEKLGVERGEITAIVLEYPYENSDKTRLYFNAKITEIDGKSVKAKARLSFPAKPWKKNTPMLPEDTKKLEPGDRISFSGKLYKIAENSAGIHNYFKSKGICLAAYPLGFVECQKGAVKNVFTILMKERKKAINQILNAFGKETAGVIISLLTGERRYVSDSLYKNFSRAGVAHLMAVSGLHLSIWIMFVLEILKKQNSLTKKKIFVLIVFVVLIMFFASFSGSVRRAGIMMILFLCSELFNGEADSFNSLGFSAVCILLQNPYSAVNASFLLSFVSTLAIIVLALPATNAVVSKLKRRRRPKMLESALGSVAVSLFISVFVNIATLPFQISYFGGVSVVGILTNLLLIPVATPMILSGGLYVMFYFVPLFSNLLHFAAEISVGYCKAVVNLLGSFGFSYAVIEEKYVAVAAAFSALVSLLTMLFFKKKHISDYI